MPKIIEIIAGDSHGFNHPFEQYANFKPSVTLKALVEDGEDPGQVARDLLAKAHGLVIGERERIEEQIERERLIAEAEQALDSLPGQITYQRREIDHLTTRGWSGDAEQIKRHERAIQIFDAQKPVLEERLRLLRSGTPVKSLPPVPQDGSTSL